MEKEIYRKKESAMKQKSLKNRKDRRNNEQDTFMSASFVIFVIFQFVVYSFLAVIASRWYSAIWTLMSFNNLFVTTSFIACGLTAISIVVMLAGLVMMMAGKKAGRFFGLVALSITALGCALLCIVVVVNAITTNTAVSSLTTLYFIPVALGIINAIAGTIFLLRAEGLKEHLAYRNKQK